MVLLASDGMASDAIAAVLGCNRLTVRRWRQRYSDFGLEGLEEAGGRGAKPRLTRAFVNGVVAATMEKPKHGVTHWSARDLGRRFGISHSTVLRIWNDHGLQPHRTRSFKFSPDPELVDKVNDIVGLYLHPPEKAVVLCVDEKSQIQALDRTQPLLPMRPHQVERRSHDYKRHGTTTLFAALDIATGQVTERCYSRHRHQQFLRFLQRLAQTYPSQELHLVVDNYRTHKHPVVREWLANNPRFHLHFTPIGASWMNQVETWFSILQRKAITRGVFRSVPALVAAIQRFVTGWNQHSRPFSWIKSADAILAKANRLSNPESVH
jgi:transposase